MIASTPKMARNAWSEAMNIMILGGYSERIEYDPEVGLNNL
jgi:hypothetical protein